MYTCNPGIWEVGVEGQPEPHKALKQALKKGGSWSKITRDDSFLLP